ncbi:MAG: NAD-dependent succinate-semialdehyde dehydrogenase [Hyphomicrobiales bacterium]
MKSINPKNNQLIRIYSEHSFTDVQEILEQNFIAWQSWKNTTFEHRAELMLNAAKVIRKNKDYYARVITREMGKPVVESLAEVEKSALACDYYAENAEKFLADEDLPSNYDKSFVAYEPMGPVLAVMPWNYPFWQVFRFAAPALMAGNAGLLKHSSYVPECALAIEDIFKKAGFPENIFRSLMVSASHVNMEEVIADRRIKAVTLTGSELAGSKVAEASGKNIKKTVLELGGSDVFIVFDDANLEKAIDSAITARFQNAGQSCIAGKRFLVHENVYSQFLEGVRERILNINVDDPELETTQMGPMCRSVLRDEIHQQVMDTVRQGATLMCGGAISNLESGYYPPTLLADLTTDMIAFKEETFGPVMAVAKFSTEEEAIKVANTSDYGLGGSVWSEDRERAERVARQIETGAVFINAFTKSSPGLPFGGVKYSGYGRELSHFGIKEFMNIKTICVS